MQSRRLYGKPLTRLCRSAIAADRQAARDRDRIMALEHEATMKALQEKYKAVMAFQNNINLRPSNPDMGKEKETATHKTMVQKTQTEVSEDHHSGVRERAKVNHDINLTVDSNQLASVVVGEKVRIETALHNIFGGTGCDIN